MITIEFNSNTHAIIDGPEVNIIREHFSVKNEAVHFQRRFGRFVPPRTYVITNQGKVEIGLLEELMQFCKSKDILFKLQAKIKDILYPSLTKTNVTPYDLSLKLREYQQDIVNACIHHGRGTVILATAGGKTLAMASLLEFYYKNYSKNFRCLVIVPDLGLANQTKNDFKEYNTSFTTSKWTGKDELDLSTNVIVSNLGILQSSKQDISWIEHIDMLIVDEVHKVRRGNKVNKLFRSVNTPNRFGFTGTLPPDNLDKWNIFGKIGPQLYEKMAHELRDNNYVAKSKVHVLQLNYNTPTAEIYHGTNSNAYYLQENEFIRNSSYRNNIIGKLCNKLDNNGLILVDYIEHGELLLESLQSICKYKDVYFIQGSVDVDYRKEIQNYMEAQKNVIVIAISKIFSTGINIKNLHYIVFGGVGKAKIKIVQSIGRGLRLHIDKQELIIFDIADNLRYGQRHIEQRLALYDTERIKYTFTQFNETKKKKEK